MATKRRQSRATQTTMAGWGKSSDVYNGHIPGLDRQLHGVDKHTALERAREFGKENVIVRVVNKLKVGFFNYKLRIKGIAEEKDLNMARDYVLDVWNKFLVSDNVVTFWRKEDGQPGALLTLDLKNCTYSDAMGIERMRIRLNLTSEDVKLLPKALHERYSKPELKLPDRDWEEENPEHAEYFKVLRRGSRGEGFAEPVLSSAFPELEEFKSLQVGNNVMAEATKDMQRCHMKGHEIKNGPHAGSPKHFMKKEFGEALKTELKKKKGLYDIVQNFDYKQTFSYLDPKAFDPIKWKGVIERLVWWGGPVAFMFIAKGFSPSLIQLLGAEAAADRDLVGRHLEEVLSERFGTKVKISWSDKCFTDMRLAFDMWKTLLTAGPLDTTTALEQGGFDPDEIRERKRADLKMEEKEPGMLTPIFDANHGGRPGKNGERGRPEGARDKNNARQEG